MRHEKRVQQDRETLAIAGAEKRGSLSFPIKQLPLVFPGERTIKGQERELGKPDLNSASKKLFKTGRSPSRVKMSFLGVMVLLTGSALVAQGSLLEFGQLIKELTGKSALLSYITYGCHCGLGGKGQPKDATDRCCLTHDCCYERLSQCNPKTDRYKYTYENGVVTCGTGTWCETQICECDKAAAVCFRENLKSYDKKFRFYRDSHCKEATEQC